jgi:hypothetical protein
MLKLSVFLPRAQTPECSIFLGMEACSWLIERTCSPDQGTLRWIVSGTGAVPTDNVTLLSTKES